MPPKKKKIKWQHSKAKQYLRAEIVAGNITEAMAPKAVFEMLPQRHKAWGYKNFPSRLRSLRGTIKRDYARMQVDCESYGHDLALLLPLRESQPPKPAPWHKSKAFELLKVDIDNGLHKTTKPMALWATRPEYQAFSLTIFRNHIYQEVDARSKRSWRFEKKKRKQTAREALEEIYGEGKEDDHGDG
jgi:hypothetical protein